MVIVNVFLWTILILVALLAMDMIKAYQMAEKKHARQMRVLCRALASRANAPDSRNDSAARLAKTQENLAGSRYAYASAQFVDLTDHRAGEATSNVEFVLPSRQVMVPAQDMEISGSHIFCA